jgi:phage tail-like protein
MAREVPYGNFNYVINFDGSEEFGGFSDVSGLGLEITVAEYRAGNYPLNHPRKIPGVHKVPDVTLKRGIIDSSTLWAWLDQAMTEGPAAKKEVTITLQDEAHNPVQIFTLHAVIPMKYTGPTLAAKGGTDVAMEELVLSCEGIEIAAAG